jgi:diguanylate cyclase (GGDEF)-like protein
MIDVDRFKDVNDRFGHQVGDRALVFMTQTIGASIRKTDLLARYGGEEFVVAFLNTDQEGCLERSELLRRKVADTPLPVEGGEAVRVTFSAGLVWHDYARGNAEIDDLIRKADRALYRAKANGRNRVVAWEE